VRGGHGDVDAVAEVVVVVLLRSRDAARISLYLRCWVRVWVMAGQRTEERWELVSLLVGQLEVVLVLVLVLMSWADGVDIATAAEAPQSTTPAPSENKPVPKPW